MKKKHKRRLLIVVALFFLLESWLWDAAGALVGRLLRALPFEEYKQRLSDYIERLDPLPALGLFIIPVLVLLPLKFLALWLLSKGFIFSGIGTVVCAKIAGLGGSSFLFTLCKPKLLQLRFIRWLYHHCLYWRAKAYAMVKPYTRFIQRYLKALRPKGKTGKLLAKIRTRMHKAGKPT